MKNTNIKKNALHAAPFACLLGACMPALAADNTSLSWNGITLFGTIDVDISHQNHGAPLSQDFPAGATYLIQKYSNKSVTSVAPNGLSQSKIGLKGKEELVGGLAGIFNLEMGFQPTSGNLTDGPRSLVHNNGVPLSQQVTASDSARAGQLFNGSAYAGIESARWGTLTAGRNNTPLLDLIGKYDPQGGSYAFSLIGYSGTTAGGGATEDTRLDDSLKYSFKHDWFRLSSLYQFGKSDASPGEAWQVGAGADYGAFSLDGMYAHKKDAISAASLSAAQAATAPAGSLAATISDNTAYALAASYATPSTKIYGGFERIRFENPDLPITNAFSGLGGYSFSVINNNAFPHPKVLKVYWVGLKYLISNDFDVTGAWYHLGQNAFGATKCSGTSAANCSGTQNVYSVKFDYRLSKRWDWYFGLMYSRVEDGLASGFLHNAVLSPTMGIRFSF